MDDEKIYAEIEFAWPEQDLRQLIELLEEVAAGDTAFVSVPFLLKDDPVMPQWGQLRFVRQASDEETWAAGVRRILEGG